MTDDPGEATMRFEIVKSIVADGPAARLGRLVVSHRRDVQTPGFFCITSRGAVPHLTPDNLSKHVQPGGSYLALEDCE